MLRLMSTKEMRLIVQLVIALVCLSASTASAEVKKYTVPESGNDYSRVQIAVIYGNVWINISNPFTNYCYWDEIASGSTLHDDVIVDGSSRVDHMFVHQKSGTASLCGTSYPTQAVDQGGFAIWLDGRGGDDYLQGSTVTGGSGDDRIELSAPLNGPFADGEVWAEGDGGYDIIVTHHKGAMYGDDGNDKLCAPSTLTMTIIDGGRDTDVYCARNSSARSATKNCNACAPYL